MVWYFYHTPLTNKTSYYELFLRKHEQEHEIFHEGSALFSKIRNLSQISTSKTYSS